MGNYSSRRSTDSGLVTKCLKTEQAFDIHHPNSAKDQQNQEASTDRKTSTTSFVSSWDTLPYVAVVEVYKYLSNNDKASMSRTCKAWLTPFSRPAVWRKGNFRFDGVEDWRAMRFASLMGSGLRHLIADCSVSEERIYNRTKTSCVNLCSFLNSLIVLDIQKLQTLCLRNLRRLKLCKAQGDDYSSPNLLELLLSLLEKQHQLCVLDITNAGLFIDEAIHILQSVVRPKHMDKIVVTDFVVQRFDIFRDMRFVEALTRFTNLKDLRINEEYISHELLLKLVSSTALTLRYLEVNSNCNVGRWPHEILEESWAYFCDQMTNLEISFIVKGVFAGRNITRILPPSLNLSRLDWDASNCLIKFKTFILHLVKFKGSLRHLHIVVQIVTEDDAEYLFRLIKCLPNLRRLSIEAPFIHPTLQNMLERSIRRHLNAIPDEGQGTLKDVVINGKTLDMTESWYASITAWLAETI